MLHLALSFECFESGYRARITPVSFMFERRGCIRIQLNSDGEHFESVWDAATEAGAEDFEEYDSENPQEKEIEVCSSKISRLVK